MTSLTMNSDQHTSHRGDLTIAALAFGSASAGILLGGSPLLVALIALVWPLAAFVAYGHLAGRGAVMVCLISALAAGMGTGGVSAWSSVGLLATIDLMALAGGLVADRMAPLAKVAAQTEIVAMPITQQVTFVRSARPTQRARASQPVRLDRSA